MNKGYSVKRIGINLSRGDAWRPAGALPSQGPRAFIDARDLQAELDAERLRSLDPRTLRVLALDPQSASDSSQATELTFSNGMASFPAGQEVLLDVSVKSANGQAIRQARWRMAALPGGVVRASDLLSARFVGAGLGVLDVIGTRDVAAVASGALTGVLSRGPVPVTSREAVEVTYGYPVGTVYVDGGQWLQVRFDVNAAAERPVFLQSAFDPIVSVLNMPHGGSVFVNGAEVSGAWDSDDYRIWSVFLRQPASNATIRVTTQDGAARETRGTIRNGTPLVLEWSVMRPVTSAVSAPVYLPQGASPTPGQPSTAIVNPLFPGQNQAPTLARLRIVGMPHYGAATLNDAQTSGRWETDEARVWVIDSVPGLFALKVVAPNGEARQSQVDLRAGAALAVNHADMSVTTPGQGANSPSAPATLRIGGLPPYAAVTLNGGPVSGRWETDAQGVWIVSAEPGVYVLKVVAPNGEARQSQVDLRAGLALAVNYSDMPLLQPGGAGAEAQPDARGLIVSGVPAGALVTVLWRPFAEGGSELLRVARSTGAPVVFADLGRGNGIVDVVSRPELNAPMTPEGTMLLREAAINTQLLGSRSRKTVTLEADRLDVPFASLEGIASTTMPEARPGVGSAQLVVSGFERVVVGGGGRTLSATASPDRPAVFDLAAGTYVVDGTRSGGELFRKQVELRAGQRIVESPATMNAVAPSPESGASGTLKIRDLPGYKPTVYRGAPGATQGADLAAAWPLEALDTDGVRGYQGPLPEGVYTVRSGCTAGPAEANQREVTIRAGQTSEVGFAHLALCGAVAEQLQNGTMQLASHLGIDPSLFGSLARKFESLLAAATRTGLLDDELIAFEPAATARLGMGITGYYPRSGRRAGPVVLDLAGGHRVGQTVGEFEAQGGTIAVWQPNVGFVLLPINPAVAQALIPAVAFWRRVYPAGISDIGGN